MADPYDSDIKKVGESWVWYVEIEPRTCDEIYGVSPCTASGGQCSYSWATCTDKANFDLTTDRLFKFSSKQGEHVFRGENVQPTLVGVSDLPTEINPEKSTTINARLQMTFEDVQDPFAFDADKGSGKYHEYRQGTFWRIFTRIYRESYKYCTVRIYEGLATYESKSDFSLRRELKINNIEFNNNGMVTVTATDKTRTTKTIKIPNAISSTNVLTSALTSSSSLIDITDASEFKLLDSPYRSIVKIIDSTNGDEYIEFNDKDDILNELYLPSYGGRGLFGTTEVDHAIGCKVIQVAMFCNYDDTGISSDEGVNPVDVIKEILLAWVKIPSADIDTTEFDSQRDLWYASLRYRRIVETPIGADELISQVNQFMMSNVWQDESQKITFKAFQPASPGGVYSEFDIDKNVIDNSVKINNRTEKAVSRVTVHFAPQDIWGTKDHTEADEFTETLIWINAEAENSNGQGEPVEIEFFADWIYQISEARSFASRYIRRYSPTAPKEIYFSGTRRDSDVQTGDTITFVSDLFVFDDGSDRTVNFQILAKSESQSGIIKMKGLETKLSLKYAFITPFPFPDWISATDAQKEYGYICFEDSTGECFMSDGSSASYIW